MADFLSTGISGLLAFQRQLDVTSQNIANVGTPGYSRQRAELVTREPHPYGNGWVGSGVEVSTIRRMYDESLAFQTRTSSSSLQHFSAYATYSERINNLFANTTTGVTASLQQFTNALTGLANSPTSSAARQTVISEAQSLASRLKTYDSRLGEIDSEVQLQIKSEANEISVLATNVAQMNKQISEAYGRTGQPPNDLLDQRDALIDELSTHVNVNTVAQSDGSVNVFIGSGQPLVLGGTAAQVVTVPGEYDPTQFSIAFKTANGTVDITSSLTGGKLGGALDFRREVLDPARNAIGRISVALTDTVNQQHRSGIDATGTMGGDLFSIGGVETLRSKNNPSQAGLTVTRTDTSTLTEADYIVELGSGGWTMRNQATGAAVTLTGTGTALDPLRADGLEIVAGAGATAGDSFLVRPTRGAVSGLNVLISDPSRLAAAAPIRTNAPGTNTGTGAISAGEVIDPTDTALQDQVTIEFTTASTYSINGAGSFPYTDGDPIVVNGWSVEISGAPAVGDQFAVSDNSSGAGDNRNALKLAEVLGQPVLDNGTSSLNASVGRLVGDVGLATRQAQANRDAQQIVQNDSIAAREAVSGVNLDEEAANLLRYQQAYQAAAQLIRVASTLFDSLLNATRR